MRLALLSIVAAAGARAEIANVAIHGSAWTSHHLWWLANWHMQMLIDGDKDTAIHGDVAPTDDFSYNIDLDKTYGITQIKIYPRQDGCCPERLSNFRVSIYTTRRGEVVWSQDFFTEIGNAGSGTGALLTINLPEPKTGQTVEILSLTSPVPDYALQVADVEIFADVPPADVNRALGATVRSNRPLWGGRSPQLLVDGNRSGRNLSIVHGLAVIEAGFAYEINLGDEVDISRILIVPRQDCCPQRLTNYRVSVHPDDNGAPGNAVWSAALHEDFTFLPADPGRLEVIEAGLDTDGTFRGQWIRIESLEDPVSPYALQIGEVEVYGVPAPLRISIADTVLTWPGGILESADGLTDAWTPVEGATSPYTLPLTGSRRFYRLRDN
ncbi:MAG: discoidin domain-containing protein [Verrucomicrobiae bacterium]|nr:discoidin domain-containing protein [Verrucomicrobiae bacterium]